MELASELTAIIKEHETALLRYASRILRDSEEAKDVAQETFVRYLERRKDGETVENPSAWLFKVARNRCLDRLRLKRKELEIHLDENETDRAFADQTAEPDWQAARNDEMTIMRQKIDKLPPREREVLILKLEHGKSYKEIAAILDLSVSNVGFILHQTIKTLTRSAGLS